ncbi:hypothetical protein C8Q74DRAFT_294291 [Fomes fomentarius]|nr:hypothetical protein C8Q74DRAFT_294291 [Fomes fomentarius]
MPNLERIEDNDPRVHYIGGQWSRDSLNFASGGTATGAWADGMVVSLEFQGSGIYVYCIVDPPVDGQPTTRYDVDGETVATYTAPWANFTKTEVSFTTEGLSPESHTLAVTIVNGHYPNSFWLDYFVIVLPDAGPTSQSITPTITSRTVSSISSSDVDLSVSTSSSSTSTILSASPARTTSNIISSPVISAGHPSVGEMQPSAGAGGAPTGPPPPPDTSSHINISTNASLIPTGTRVASQPSQSPRTTSTHNVSPVDSAAGSPSVGVLRAGVIGGTISAAALIILGLVACYIRQRRRRQQRPSVPPESQSFCPPDHSQQTYQEHIGTPVSAPSALGLSRSSLTAVHEVLDAPSSNGFHAAPPIETADSSPSSEANSVGDRPRESRVTLLSKSREASSWSSRSQRSSQVDPSIDMSSAPVSAPNDVLHTDAVQSQWHAPVDLQAQVWHLLPALVTPNIQDSVPSRHDVDSGLRLYDEAILPPPYTSA